MKVLVTVKEVAVVGDEFELDGLGIDDRYLTYELNEWDDYAVEEAVQLAEAGDDVEVVVATIGPERSEETVRQALAKGADRAIRVWDDSLADLDVLDPATKATLLAAVVADEDPDLVLTGVQGGDDAYGATGVALAREVDYAWAAVVNDLDVGDDHETAAVHRELEGGVEELTDVDLPAVLTIQTGINDPRYASLRGIRQAQSKPLDVRTTDDIGIDVAALDDALTLTDVYEPETESDATVFEGDAGETADQLGDLLADKGVVDG
ncbi:MULTISPECIES: electron transfer flavoprotein subunit beta/FixA family protein [Salinibaculum]|uniref:electron transfer flavoprotein subunit beta/FixA family protein n=1 Tax=Salinibaculum TaxID=2732368 RepID=UPI0030CB8D4C